MRNDGVTLVELLIVIAIIGIIVLFATIDTAWFQRDARVTEARDRLLADIEEAKLKSITTVPHGIVVASVGATSYTVVQLMDYRCSNSSTTACLADSDCTSPGTCTVTGNLKRDAGEATSTLSTPSVSSNANVKVTLSGGTELWFDRKGVPRTSTWTRGNCSVTTATVCNEDSDCPAGETCNRTFTVWYDANGNGSVDADEPNKTITISSGGRVKYEQ
jgi:prepilin-type N-terminal cleavage/methylation domain-containing protein